MRPVSRDQNVIFRTKVLLLFTLDTKPSRTSKNQDHSSCFRLGGPLLLRISSYQVLIEKRTSPRKTVLMSGTIEFAGSTINCLIRNMGRQVEGRLIVFTVGRKIARRTGYDSH
jgi:hypothetical protein